MKKWLNYLPTIFIITIVIALITYSTQGSVRGMNYTEFQDIAKTAEFQDADLNISNTVIKVEGTYKEKETPSSTMSSCPIQRKTSPGSPSTLKKTAAKSMSSIPPQATCG